MLQGSKVPYSTEDIFREIEECINLLYIVPCVYSRNLILNQLRDKVAMLRKIVFVEGMQIHTQQAMEPAGLPQGDGAGTMMGTTQQGTRVYTLEELAKYNGKNGMPAYVAVNGIVYDVTGNAAWAAATHFGLSAGKDLTDAFASCHAGQQILNKLKIVGRLQV